MLNTKVIDNLIPQRRRNSGVARGGSCHPRIVEPSVLPPQNFEIKVSIIYKYLKLKNTSIPTGKFLN
jgi:hypothetical protein